MQAQSRRVQIDPGRSPVSGIQPIADPAGHPAASGMWQGTTLPAYCCDPRICQPRVRSRSTRDLRLGAEIGCGSPFGRRREGRSQYDLIAARITYSVSVGGLFGLRPKPRIPATTSSTTPPSYARGIGSLLVGFEDLNGLKRGKSPTRGKNFRKAAALGPLGEWGSGSNVRRRKTVFGRLPLLREAVPNMSRMG